MIKIAVVGIPGKWSTEVLADAIEEQTSFRLVVDMADVRLDLTDNQLYYKEHNLCLMDAIIVKKIASRYSPNVLDRLELLRVAEAQGVRVYSRAEHILRLIDRLSCTVTMRAAGLPMPKTSVTENIEHAFNTVKNYQEAVFKPLYSTKAQGMTVISASSSDEQILSEIKQFKADNAMMYIQQKVNLPGKDLGLVFLGGRYLGTYARVGTGDSWNTTILSGGKYEAFHPDEQIIEMAHQAQSLFDMDFTTVDIAETDAGPIVFEVSAFGGFKGAWEGMGVNVAQQYTDYVIGHFN